MARSTKARAAPAPSKRTAVVVVHGMGEQRPMETLWGLVQALWTCDPGLGAWEKVVYSKPDDITGSFELRRITTRAIAHGRRFDFFEFYWAHLMEGNTIAAVWASVQALLFRKPSSVPPRLFKVWLVGLLAVAVIGLILAVSALSALPTATRGVVIHTLGLDGLLGGLPGFLWLIPLALAGLLRWAGQAWIGPVAGDAARYLNAAPPNVGVRQTIREAAVDLIEKLHASGLYDRIVIIGHSLGTVVAYDALTFAWGRVHGPELARAHAASPRAAAALGALETAAKALHDAEPEAAGPLRERYRDAQRAYFAELAALSPKDSKTPFWLVSDFVSTAAPLSKADVLMARDGPGFDQRISRREFPSCPPVLERQKPPRFSYTPPGASGRAPHHAAAFGPTVWTNIYFETEAVVLGDVIAGRCAPLFGPGVLDVRLKRGGALIRHLDYWKDPTHAEMSNGRPHPWITALRRAVNLDLRSDRELWGALADAEEVAADIL